MTLKGNLKMLVLTFFSVVGLLVYVFSRPIMPYTVTYPAEVTRTDNIYSKETQLNINVNTAFLVDDPVELRVTVKVELPALDAEELVGETVTVKITDDRYKVLFEDETTFRMGQWGWPVANFVTAWTPPKSGKYYIDVNPSHWFLMGRYNYEIAIQHIWQETINKTETRYTALFPSEIGISGAIMGLTACIALISTVFLYVKRHRSAP